MTALGTRITCLRAEGGRAVCTLSWMVEVKHYGVFTSAVCKDSSLQGTGFCNLVSCRAIAREAARGQSPEADQAMPRHELLKLDSGIQHSKSLQAWMW